MATISPQAAATRHGTRARGGRSGGRRTCTFASVSQRARCFPGDEGAHYTLNSAEGFAEAYRQTVYDSFSWTNYPMPAWDVVDSLFKPDLGAEQAIGLDVTSPWDANDEQPQVFSGP